MMKTWDLTPLYASVGSNVRDVNFWRSSLEMCKEDVELFCELVKE